MMNFLFASAQDSSEKLFIEGNTAYNDGDFAKAVSFYEQTLEEGQHSAALYFNLGNAFYRLNNVAESIYYFEKANQLDPDNEDFKVNSAFAQNMTIDAIEPLPESQLSQFQKALYVLANTSIWSKIVILFMWLFAIFFSIYLLNKSNTIETDFLFYISTFFDSFYDYFSDYFFGRSTTKKHSIRNPFF